MLDVTLLDSAHAGAAAGVFHRDGFVCIRDALTRDQLALARAGADRVVAEQMRVTPLAEANRGHARYSFGPQLHHPEWTQLDIEARVFFHHVLERAAAGADFQCSGGGGDYAAPGARMQHLHADIRDFLDDPLGRVTVMDLPTPYIVVNFLVTDFTTENGPTRFVRGTHRNRHPIPALDEEPNWMQESVLVAPAGTGLIRDVRCWHGGTPNRSSGIRIMTSVGYSAPWFRLANRHPLPRDVYQGLSVRARELTKDIAEAAQ